MFQSSVSKRSLFLALLFAICILAVLFFSQSIKSQARVVFCDVGQGDGAYIRLINNVDIVIDAGPNDRILECLGKYMPFYDRSIEYAFISHPQKDHYGGFIPILDRYKVKSLWLNPIFSESKLFKKLITTVRNKKIKIYHPLAGDILVLADTSIRFYWPSQKFLLENSVIDPKTDTQYRVTGLDPNNFSMIFTLKNRQFSGLFTGDATSEVLNRLLDQSEIKSKILKIPHHGSKRGLSKEFLRLADPTYAVISAGKKNSYGHPSTEVLDMLKASNVQTKRTDLKGDIVFRLTQ